MVAAGSNDTSIIIWDTSTGEILNLLLGHTGFVRGIAWSPDGTRLASVGFDGTLRIWGVPSTEILDTP
jgi:WD40 repeat protein